MKTETESENRPLKTIMHWAVTGSLALLLFLSLSARGGAVVTECTESNLRSAMAGGGTVTFACDGTITLASTITNTVDSVLDASGHQIVISGGNAVRVFFNPTNESLTLIDLTITGGLSPRGSGIRNDGGTLILLGITLSTNVAQWGFEHGDDFPFADGGAVFGGGGRVSGTNCTFAENEAIAPFGSLDQPLRAQGGALRNENGLMELSHCVFTSNKAVGGPGYNDNIPNPGANGLGGAIHNSGTLTAHACSFALNSAIGGSGASPGPSNSQWDPGFFGGDGGAGEGGAFWNEGELAISRCAFIQNMAGGGTGATGGTGYTDLHTPTAGGVGGIGGDGNGGAFVNWGNADLVNCTIAGNSGTGGAGGDGGQGGTGLAVGTWGGNGGNGGRGGSAVGGIFDPIGGVRLTNSTVVSNHGQPGNGGQGGPGGPGGPGSTYPVPKPPGEPGKPGATGTNGTASGGIFTAGATLANTLLANNMPTDGLVDIVDAGHNLSSDGSCAFTNTGSFNNTDPLLGPLADNGGPTLTMALLPGSPAIDAGDNSASPPTDQRGLPRPFGASADIGAYEYVALLRFNPLSGDGFEVSLRDGIPDNKCLLMTSTDFLDWQCLATNQIGPDGTALFPESYDKKESHRFYRALLP